MNLFPNGYVERKQNPHGGWIEPNDDDGVALEFTSSERIGTNNVKYHHGAS